MPSGEYGGPRGLNKRTWFKMFLLGFEAGVSKLGALFPATEAIPICDSHSSRGKRTGGSHALSFAFACMGVIELGQLVTKYLLVENAIHVLFLHQK
ncbi:hypothetical protein VNO77_26745 [Canavalia gladiata]|uniref:Uncharacterized protein n=1 Tax=Canavalia gladiata TaxID=3824 RepID=A0AAN9KSU3_CANGL